MTANILVTGGAGYIGSHVAYTLCEAGYTPVVVDNLVNGNKWAAKFGPFEQADIGDSNAIRSFCEKYQPVALMHFAAFIEVGESVTNPKKYFKNNATKAKKLFQTVHECGVENVVFSSTAAVYGDVKSSSPLAEDLPLLPINPYGQSKLDAETDLRTYNSRGMRSVSLRYFNASGAAPAEINIGEAHFPESHLIPRVVLSLLNIDAGIDKALGLASGFTIYGDDFSTPDGTAIRDYIHVLDLADAHVLALKYLLADGETNVLNLGNGTGFSVREVLDTTQRIIGNNFMPRIVPRRAGDPAILIADSSRARQTLKWQPHRNLSEIIQSAADWFKGSLYRETLLQRIKAHQDSELG